MGSSFQTPSESKDQKSKPFISMTVMREDDYQKVHSEKISKQERERNMLLLLKLRPGFFSPEEQQRYQEITGEIKKTALIVVAGFITTSAHRAWAIKSGNKSVAQGISVILLSYMPGFLFYSYHNGI